MSKHVINNVAIKEEWVLTGKTCLLFHHDETPQLSQISQVHLCEIMRHFISGCLSLTLDSQDLYMIIFIDDDVYLEDKAAIKEYVMKQNGIIYMGTAEDPQAKKWYYGQVKNLILNILYFSKYTCN